MLLTEQIRLMEEQLRNRKDQTRRIVTADNPEERRLRHQISALEHQIHLISSLTASTQTSNSALKSRIDSYRREHYTYKHAISTLTEDLRSVEVQCERQEDQRTKVLDETLTQQRKLEQLRSKSAQHQYRQRTRIVELTVATK